MASLLQRRRSTEANQTWHDVLPSPGLVGLHNIHFSGLLSPKGILPGAKFTLHRSLALSYIGTRAVDVSQTLRRGTRNGIKELSPRAPPIFGRAAITMGMASAYIIVARVNNVLCTFRKQKMIVLAHSEVRDVKVT